MSAKHTTGPWKVLPSENEQGSFDIDSVYGYHIAETIGGLDDEEKANARLIAAAPDLLNVLTWLANEYEEGEGNIPDGLYMAARAAIAKATGETL